MTPNRTEKSKNVRLTLKQHPSFTKNICWFKSNEIKQQPPDVEPENKEHYKHTRKHRFCPLRKMKEKFNGRRTCFFFFNFLLLLLQIVEGDDVAHVVQTERGNKPIAL